MSRNIPTITDLFQEKLLDLSYPELLENCDNVEVELTDMEIKVVGRETVDQAKGGAFFNTRLVRLEHEDVKLQATWIHLYYHSH